MGLNNEKAGKMKSVSTYTRTFLGANFHLSEARDVLFPGGKQAAKIRSGEVLSQSFKGDDERCSRELMTCQPDTVGRNAF